MIGRNTGRKKAYSAVLVNGRLQSARSGTFVPVALAISESSAHYALEPVRREGMDDAASKYFTCSSAAKRLVVVRRVKVGIAHKSGSGSKQTVCQYQGMGSCTQRVAVHKKRGVKKR